MTAGSPKVRIALGLAGAALAFASFHAFPAHAQDRATPLRDSLDELRRIQAPAADPDAAPTRGTISRSDSVDDDETAQGQKIPDLRRASDGDPDSDEARRQTTADPSEMAVDGDLSFPREAVEQKDGDLPEVQPLPSRNDAPDPRGVNLGTTTLREAEFRPGSDAETGNGPGTLLDVVPNGRPSLGFETDFDYVNPTNAQTRALRAFTAQPYDPLGISVASFRLFPQLETSGILFGNVFRAPADAKQDTALDLKPSIRVISNWSSHLLDVTVSGDRSYHALLPGEDDRAYTIDAKGRIDITKRTNVELQAQSSYQQEQRGSINDPSTAGSRVNADVNVLGATFNQRFNRLSLQVRGSLSDFQYSGGATTTPERNSTSKDAAVRASYELRNGFSVFSEVAGNWRDYERASSVDGIKRDLSGTRVRTGVALATTFWTGEASVGYARQDYADGRLMPVEGITVDSVLTWRPTVTDAILFTARSDITESTLAGSGGGVSRNYGVEYRHNLARYWLVNGGVVFSTVDYGSVGTSDREWITTLGTEYYMSRQLVLFGRYDHFDFVTTLPGRNFTDDQLRVGVRFRQ